jgi:ketosteroid isomerase-like protein
LSRVKTLRAVLVAALVAVAAGACGADPEAEIGEAFQGYYTALLARDFPAACAYNAPEATAKLLTSVATQGISARTCEEAFTAVFAEGGPAETADAIARSAKIDDIEVDGQDATVHWTAEVDGEPMSTTWGMRRIDGAWKLVLTN